MVKKTFTFQNGYMLESEEFEYETEPTNEELQADLKEWTADMLDSYGIESWVE